MEILDARQTRTSEGGPSFSLGNRAFRALWTVVWVVLAAWTPPPWHPWRRFLLRLFGAKVGRKVAVHASARIWYPPYLDIADFAVLGRRSIIYSMAPITIGHHAVISQGAHLCAGSHDIDDDSFQLIAAPIFIGARAWVAAETFVGPGVTIGEGAVLGARGVAFHDLAPHVVFAGNPAKPIRKRKYSAQDDKPGDLREAERLNM